MDIIYFLIPLALVFVIAGIGLFFWAVKNDQYEDLEGPAHRILFDDIENNPSAIDETKNNKPNNES